MKRSLGLQLAVIVFVTIATVGVAGFLAGRSILEQVVGLADDKLVTDALSTGQQALAELHRERQGRVEPVLATCATAGAKSCEVSGVPISVEVVPAGALPGAAAAATDEALPRWDGETTYVAAGPAGTLRFHLGWPELKPRFATLTSVIGTREHVTALLPGLAHSFLMVFAASLAGAGCLGMLVTYILSRRIALRVKLLTAYTRQIAAREVLPAPAATRGADELGLLASAMEEMAQELDEVQRRLLLTEKMHSWQTVARKVAHEIKNPLTPLSLVAAELKRRAAEAPPALRGTLEETSRILAEETESLGRMVREFSAFARLPEPQLVAGDLGDVVRDFVARNATEAGPALRLAVDQVGGAGAADFRAVLDRGMIAQVLHNLVNNARLAKAPARVAVSFTLRREARRIFLDVQDDAGGVPEALRQTLFDAYVTSRSTGDGEKGMGLGLAISRKIALDHGGSLDLAATGPGGSRFTLTLPAQ